MDDLHALEGGSAATHWQKQHVARQRRQLQKQHRAEAKANKLNLLREARADLKKRKAKWLAGWKRNAAAALAAGLPKPAKKGAPWRLGTENPQVVDMTGMTFGRLTVIRSAPISLTMRTAQRCRVWVVKCSCGSPERMVNGTTLRQGNCKSCGCWKRERVRAAFAEKRAERVKLAKAPLSIQIAELRYRIFKKLRVIRRDTGLLDAIRQVLVQDEVRQGIRRIGKSGRAMLVRPAGVKAAHGGRPKTLTLH